MLSLNLYVLTLGNRKESDLINCVYDLFYEKKSHLKKIQFTIFYLLRLGSVLVKTEFKYLV